MANGESSRINVDDWLRWAIGGLVAGLVAYAGVGSRLASLETAVEKDGERAKEERVLMRATIDALTFKINSLTEELHSEEEARKEGELRRWPGTTGSSGGHTSGGSRFDK